ncbi:protein shifted-like [Uloborus diversus]|uniref:protein shifted-like n=1 Tax=Uloborus diversus TaxID=327109 RepID=UPI0024094156|nr:protein shifted-like [Uloborus diversus]
MADEKGFPMDIFVITDAAVLPYILDPNFEKYLPVIPSEVNEFKFTWRSPDHEYHYEFFKLKSLHPELMRDPVLSIEPRGRVPRRNRSFSVTLRCVGGSSGTASFEIGIKIENQRGLYLPGTPLSLHLRKQCATQTGPDPLCDKRCANGGRCNAEKICECPKGYMGKFCESALCYPNCMNGGTCVSPGICACPDGYQGPHCEGGLCLNPCLNKGKCIRKDRCKCTNGYYGERCEYSKCKSVPCLNGGRCIGINKCRCKEGYSGNQCEVSESPQLIQGEFCKKKCVHGTCLNQRCSCEKGWFGSRCKRSKCQNNRLIRFLPLILARN